MLQLKNSYFRHGVGLPTTLGTARPGPFDISTSGGVAHLLSRVQCLVPSAATILQLSQVTASTQTLSISINGCSFRIFDRFTLPFSFLPTEESSGNLLYLQIQGFFLDHELVLRFLSFIFRSIIWLHCVSCDCDGDLLFWIGCLIFFQESLYVCLMP